jgi:hypothetical protein
METDIILDSDKGIIEFTAQDVVAMPTNGNSATILISARNGNITLGGSDADGDLVLRDANGEETIQLTGGGGPIHGSATIVLDGPKGNLTLGSRNADGDLVLRDESGKETIQLTAGGGPTHSSATILLDGKAGRVTLKGDLVLPGIGSLVHKINDLESRLAALE